MAKFKRITDQEMEVLAAYMDDKVREEVHSRFAPCTNEEFAGQVFLRGGVSREELTEVLQIELEELERTFIMIDRIKYCLCCSNGINFMEKAYPKRDLVKEQSEKGRRYRHYLKGFSDHIERFRNEMPGFSVLSDLDGQFPEIDVYINSGYMFYMWDGVIL